MIENIGAGVILRKEDSKGELLLVKRRFEPYKGYWNPPGGRIEKGETLRECVRREIKEETGLTVKVIRLLKSYKDKVEGKKYNVNLFLTKLMGGKLRENSEEWLEMKWWSLDKLEELKIVPKNKKILLESEWEIRNYKSQLSYLSDSVQVKLLPNLDNTPTQGSN